jgi:hypothetical protein
MAGRDQSPKINTLLRITDQGRGWFMVLGSFEFHQCLARRVDSRQEIAGTSQMDRRSKNMLGRIAASLIRQWATVFLTITAWLLLSNHCALGLSGTLVEADSVLRGCPMHSAPAKGKPAANLPCCKELRAIASHAGKSIAAGASRPVGVRDYVAAIFLMPPRVTARVPALDTGPPQTLSFAESILQRSILAHAPPAGLTRL